MELRQLKYFAKVAETLNFSEAAKILNITQSTLSQQIKQLESELDTPLFFRSSHSVSLTEAGELLLPHVHQTLYDANVCIQRIQDMKNISTGTLNIGVTYSFSPILTESILTFMKMYPNIKLNVYYRPMSELMDLLKAGSVDFALAFRPNSYVEGVESHILFQSYLAAIVGEHHPLANKDKVTLPELEKYDIALPVKGLQARNVLDEILPGYVNLKVKIELNEANILLHLVRCSNLVTVLAEASIHNEKGVKAIPIEISGSEMTGCVHTLKDTYRKQSMMEFIRILSESLAVKERRDAWI